MILRALMLFLFVVMPLTAWSQSAATEPDDAPREVLTLDQAITRALEHNRLLKHEQLEVEKADARAEIARTRRLPQFEVDLLALQTITPIDFRFERGSRGGVPPPAPRWTEAASGAPAGARDNYAAGSDGCPTG